MGRVNTPVFIVSLIFLFNSAQCQGQCRSGSSSLNALLNNVLSPANLEAMKHRKIAGRKNHPYVANEYLANALPNIMPATVLPSGIMPANVLPSGIMPANVLPNAYMPANVFPNAYVPPTVLPNVPIYQTQVMPKLVEAVDIPKRVNPVPVNPTFVITEQPVLPAPLINPYLPAASPVSALAPPTSNLLPPADLNNSKCNFLRKIPIPPPTL